MPLYNGGRIGSNNKPFSGTVSNDLNYSNVSLLLNGNGTNGSTTFTDSSSYGHTLINTNITVNTTTKKYGTGSLYFSTSAYGTFSHDTSFDIGTGDYTIEAWVYPQSSGTRGIAHNHPSLTGGGFTFWINSNSKLVIQNFTNGSSSATNIVATTTTPNGTWAHVAYSRSGGTGYLFVNGNLQGTHTDSTNLTNNSAFYIGVAEGTLYKGIGYVDDLRFTVGVARYTSNFTPPTAQLPGGETGTFASGLWTLEEHSVAIRKELWPGLITGIVTDGLILHLDAGDSSSYPGSGTTWSDLSGQGNNATLTNGPTYSSADGGSIVFDGSNDYVTTGNELDPVADGLFADSSSSWSVTSWFNSDTVASGDRAITGKGGGTGSSATYVTYQSSGNLNVRLRGGTITTVSSISANTWYQVTVTWDGTTAKSYLNGAFTTNLAVGTASKQTNNFCIGATASGVNNFFDGKISFTSVYDRALTAAEVTQNFDALKGRYGL
jgi:hypothetical protein